MNAIFLCAGQGNRFRPSSFLRPKPLTPIEGVPNVELTIRMLHSNGIKNITMVVGYLVEQFDYLARDYGVELVFNPAFNETNSNSSLSLVTDRLDGSLLLDGDIFFCRNVFPAIDTTRSQFVVQPTQNGLEWEVLTDDAGRIHSVNKWTATGYSMCSCSYWVGEGAQKLIAALRDSKPEDYWEESCLRILADTAIYANKQDIPFALEMDSLMDAVHLQILSHEDVAELCSFQFTPVKLKGLTNSSWLIHDHQNIPRCLRIPGTGTEKYINRLEEPILIDLIKDMGVTPETHFYADGIKTTRFMEKHRVAIPADGNQKFFASLCAVLEKLHSVKFSASFGLPSVSIVEQISKFQQLFQAKSGSPLPDEKHNELIRLAALFDAEESVLCHRDLAWENILVTDSQGANLLLIDFEYAGFAHPLWEYASFILECSMDTESRSLFAGIAGITTGRELLRLREMEMLVDYTWGMWGYIQGYFDYSQIKFKRLNRHLTEFLSTHDKGAQA